MVSTNFASRRAFRPNQRLSRDFLETSTGKPELPKTQTAKK
jgi:hypothetical protein